MIMKNLSIVILAAGKGTRMNNPEVPKVLALVHKKPLIQYVLETAEKLSPREINLIVGYQAEKVIDFVSDLGMANINFVMQSEQLGTGHAVMQTEPLYQKKERDVLILSGDVPLLKAATLLKFREEHYSNKSDLSVLSATTENPFGYGRILRNESGDFTGIVEQKDATAQEQQINEINSGIYLVNSRVLFEALSEVKNSNSQGEYYLTDIVGIIKARGEKAHAFVAASFDEIQGINTNLQLENLEAFTGN